MGKVPSWGARAGAFGSLLLLAGLCALSGCQSGEDPLVVAERAKYLLAEEPQGALGVLDARALFTPAATGEAAADDATHAAAANGASAAESAASESPRSLTLLGRIGAGPGQTWEPGKAAFVVMDPSAEIPDHSQESGHDPDNCPFCKAAKSATEDASALVQVVDEQGAVVGIDARKLFDLRDGQLVVVQGQGHLDGLGNLVVAARKIYVRQ